MPAIDFISLMAGYRHLAIYQIDANGKATPLPAKASFEGQPPDPHRTTEQAPVQKFWWKDLYAKRGGTYSYRIVPLGGAPGALTPLAGVAPLVTNTITLSENGRRSAPISTAASSPPRL